MRMFTLITVGVFVLSGILVYRLNSKIANKIATSSAERIVKFNANRPIWCKTGMFDNKLPIKVLKQDGYAIEGMYVIGNDYKFNLIIDCSPYKN